MSSDADRAASTTEATAPSAATAKRPLPPKAAAPRRKAITVETAAPAAPYDAGYSSRRRVWPD